MRAAPMRVLLAFGLCLGFGLMSGCAKGPNLADVSGTLKMNGKPLGNVMVEFIPDGLTGPHSHGTTDEAGHYVLACDDERQGAMVGTNRVVLHDLAVYGDKVTGRKWENVQSKPSRIANTYAFVNQTPIKKDVKEGVQVIDIEIPGK